MSLQELLGASKHQDADGFRAIGLPMLLIIILGFICYLFWQLTRDLALQWSRLGVVHSFVLYSSIVQTILSTLMFFSAAWPVAMINLFVSLIVILATLMKDPKLTKYTFWALLALNWVIFGEPPLATASLLDRIGDPSCTAWFNSYADSMCKTGWLAALQFFATLTIAAQFANAFVFATFLLDRNLGSDLSKRDGQYETIDGAKSYGVGYQTGAAGSSVM